MPALLIVAWAQHQGLIDIANEQLERQAALTEAGGGDLDTIGHAYPPIPTFLTIALPGGTVAVAWLTALLAGFGVHAVIERLALRGVAWPLMLAMGSSVLLVPVVWFQIVDGIGEFLALIFLILALDGYLRFIVRENTLAGFRTGTMLALAFLCDPSALLYAAALVGAAPFLARDQHRSHPAAFRATASVLLFPIAAAVFSWSYLLWHVGGSPFEWIVTRGAPGSLLPAGGIDAGRSIADVIEVLAHAPLFVVIGALLARHSLGGATALMLPVPLLMVVGLLGFDVSPGLAFSLLGVLALLTAPRDPEPWATRLLMGAAALQLVLTVGWIPEGSALDALWAAVG